MKVTYYGHSCVQIEAAGQTLLFDPFLSPNPLAKDIDLSSISPDVILVSHAHQDHLADGVEIAKRSGAKVISTFEVVNWFAAQGVENRWAMNHGGTVKLDGGTIKLVNAVHTSSFADGSYGGAPAGFVLETAEGNVYFSGDTALTNDMKLIGESTRVDLAILCIGDTFTMGVADAIRAAEFVRCDRVLGVHFNTFPPIEIDTGAAKAEFKEAGKELILLPIGNAMDV